MYPDVVLEKGEKEGVVVAGETTAVEVAMDGAVEVATLEDKVEVPVELAAILCSRL
jgi:hypothetical protein